MLRHSLTLLMICLAYEVPLLGQRAPVEKAWQLLAKGEKKEAIRLLRDLIQANPGDGEARLLLGSVLQEDGNRSESIAQLTEAVRLMPRSAAAQNALGEALKTFGETEAARGPFEKAVALDPGFAQAQVNLGRVLLEAVELQPAAEHLDRSIKLLGHSPEAAYPHYLRAKICTQQNDVERAAEQLQEAVSLRPDFAEAWSDLGDARKNMGDDAAALAAFKRAVEVGPDDAVAQYRLGAEYLQQGSVLLAVPHLEESVRLNPENQSALNKLQLALRQAGRPAQADAVKAKLRELLRRKDEAERNAYTAIQLGNEGKNLEQGGNLRAALEKYQAALRLNPGHTEIRVSMGVTLLRLGDWTRGIAELREAVKRDPGNKLAKAVLEDALAQASHRTAVQR